MIFFYAFLDFFLDFISLSIFTWLCAGAVCFFAVSVILSLISGTRRAQ